MGEFTSPEDEKFFGAIGRLTISWSHLELGLDVGIYLIHRYLGGKDREKELPRALSRKLKYFKRALEHLPVSEQNLPRYKSLITDIQNASDTRHDIIHGAVVSHEEGSGEAKLVRLIYKDSGWDTKPIDASTVSILQAARDAEELATIVFQIAQALAVVAHQSTKSGDEQTQ
ncbi:MAG: hypothetical protein K8R18_09735 [Parvibaculum sp.]|uniref:hypothetical protein n=1 Tax=Parvibaculum sp. TaxID=2024848 RepID=UPI0026014FED|nr:hypothetical protein [Parvibaculum sp.]MCE9649889.1 hypothetical protein [Parvibaculum sp.]